MIYKGRAYKQWLIDRFASGFERKTIKEAFLKEFDFEISDVEIDNLLKNEEDRIKAREAELIIEIKKESLSVILRLEKLLKDLQPVLKNLKDEKNYKVYAQLLAPTLKALEMIAKIKGNIKDNTEITVNTAVIQKENYDALVELAKDGVIEIKEDAKLRKMLEIEDLK